MIYMAPANHAELERLKDPRQWGRIVTPVKSSTRIPDGRSWCIDNNLYSGCFDEVAFWRLLDNMRPYRPTCKFVVAPDVVANPIATMHLYRYYGPAIHAAGWPVAFVAQDGQELYPFPPEYDALFIGGTTEWKLSEAALWCIQQAKAAGKWVHVGRVNSQKRIRHFQLAGVDSVDGTSVTYKPDREYKVLNRQLIQRPLFLMEV